MKFSTGLPSRPGKDFVSSYIYRYPRNPSALLDDACGAPRALLSLESRQTLMKFLRDLTAIILEGAKPSKSKVPANITSKNPGTNPTAHREVGMEWWLRLLNADHKKDQPWLSYGANFSNQPYSAAPTFDNDTMIDIAENRANETLARTLDPPWMLPWLSLPPSPRAYFRVWVCFPLWDCP